MFHCILDFWCSSGLYKNYQFQFFLEKTLTDSTHFELEKCNTIYEKINEFSVDLDLTREKALVLKSRLIPLFQLEHHPDLF